MKVKMMKYLLLCFCVFSVSTIQAQEDFINPIEIGEILSPNNCETTVYNDSRNTCDYNNDVAGESNDVVYRFTLSGAASVTMNLCESLFDT
jgi:hypothetical protein